ncbi:MAG: AAA family ATPase [Mesorhizobium sp.]|nr:MAG: AAA family ATPase [Mesorhizobium sp.]
MKKATAAALKPARTDVSGPRLDDLHGLGEAGEWGRELATDLADWRAGKISWAEVDRGVLVSGPPGTGKTTFAQALARTCDVHLVLGSLARWQAKGHLGDLLKAMRAAFDEARKNAPSIIFIDEIDSVGDREKFSGDSAQYCTEVVAALLECIDGAEGREGIVVVGACNHPQRLDAALVRPGRLDRHVRIPLPNQKGREGILRWHLAGALESADLSGIVSRTEGWSGAALEQLVRDGRRMARRARRPMTLDDLATSLPSRHPLPPSLLRRAAIHEAGHVVIALALGRRFESVELRDAADRTLGYQPMGGVRISQDPVAETTVHTLLDDICILLGGLGAEGLVLGNRSVGGGGVQGSDLHRATLIALRLETSYGLGRGLAFLSTDNELDLLATLHSSFGIRERVEAVLAGQMKRTLDLLEHHKAVVERLTDALLERMRLTPAEVSKLIVGLPTVGEWISQ